MPITKEGMKFIFFCNSSRGIGPTEYFEAHLEDFSLISEFGSELEEKPYSTVGLIPGSHSYVINDGRLYYTNKKHHFLITVELSRGSIDRAKPRQRVRTFSRESLESAGFSFKNVDIHYSDRRKSQEEKNYLYASHIIQTQESEPFLFRSEKDLVFFLEKTGGGGKMTYYLVGFDPSPELALYLEMLGKKAIRMDSPR